MENETVEQIKKGAKQLLYKVEGIDNYFDFDSLIDNLKQDPSLLMRAEDICWIVPLGFIEKNKEGAIVDYYRLVVKTERQFGIVEKADEDFKFVSTKNHHREATISELLGVNLVYVNYSQEFDNEFNDEKKELVEQGGVTTIDMALIEKGADLFLYNPEVAEGPIILRRGSSVPCSLIDNAALAMHGHRNDEDHMKMFLSKIVNFKKTQNDKN